MNNGVIGVDLDGVVAEIYYPLVRWHNRVYGTSHTFDDIKHYDLTRLWGGTPEEVKRKIGEFYQSSEFAKVEPVLGAMGGTRLIAGSGNKMAIITARPPYLEEQTGKWLENNFPQRFSGVFYTNSPVRTGISKKPGICKARGVSLMIEDFAEEAEDCAKAGIPALLLTRPWNKDFELPPNGLITRVGSWIDIVREVRERF